jgi:hypothetical protein
MSDFAPELSGAWPPAELSSDVKAAKRDVAGCSEMMLLPPGLLLKSASYGAELEKWAALFPREQIKVKGCGKARGGRCFGGSR